jgi:hypothetical protein
MPAQSKSQRRLFGLALSYKRGEVIDVSDDVKKLAELPEETLKDYAETSEEGLPENLQVGDIQGMGPITLPENPGSLDAFSSQKPGSGDIPYPLGKKKKKKLIDFKEYIKKKK